MKLKKPWDWRGHRMVALLLWIVPGIYFGVLYYLSYFISVPIDMVFWSTFVTSSFIGGTIGAMLIPTKRLVE